MSTPLSQRPGIVLYDYLHCRGGAEQVTLEIAQSVPHAELCCAYRDMEAFPHALLRDLKVIDLGTGFRDGILRNLGALYAFQRRTAFLADYDWAFFGGAFAPLGAIHRPTGPNALYCHTIPRFIYDLKAYYLERTPRWRRPALKAMIGYVQPRYETALASIKTVVANSENVRGRLKRHLNREAQVIHPPCNIERFHWEGQGDYYLSTARLEPLKRVEIVVEAFKKMPEKRLMVASGGSELERLKTLAGGAANIRFTGWIDEEELQRLAGNAIATLYMARDEDFGMSPVESMAAGKPVIGAAEGGLLETVVPEKTGLLIPADPEAVVEAVEALPPARAAAMRSGCEARAARFSTDRFRQAVRGVVDGLT